jgi:hypothetical protein
MKPIAQASEFYVPGIKDKITKISEGLDTFKDSSWSHLDLLNNKEGWEELAIAKGTCYRACAKIQMENHSRYHKLKQVRKSIPIRMNSKHGTWRSLHFHHLQCLN